MKIDIDFFTVEIFARIWAWYKRRRGYKTQISKYEREPPAFRGFIIGHCVKAEKETEECYEDHDGCSSQCEHFGIEIECHENPNPDPCRDCEHRPNLTCKFTKKEIEQ